MTPVIKFVQFTFWYMTLECPILGWNTLILINTTLREEVSIFKRGWGVSSKNILTSFVLCLLRKTCSSNVHIRKTLMTCRLTRTPCIMENENVEVQPLSYWTGRLQCTSMFKLFITCKRAADGRKIYISELTTAELGDMTNRAVGEITNQGRFLRSKAIDCDRRWCIAL